MSENHTNHDIDAERCNGTGDSRQERERASDKATSANTGRHTAHADSGKVTDTAA